LVASAAAVATRCVTISRRVPNGGTPTKREAAREEREATLSIGAKSGVVIRRPNSQRKHLPESIALNIVHVHELDAPDGSAAIEWFLLTTETVDTAAQVLGVVDAYRARWRIEEFFKALKTGCAYEKRLLQSAKTLQNALALFVPVAWHLLRLRTLCRDTPSAPATTVFFGVQIDVLRRAAPVRLPKAPSIREALLAVAKLGGHRKQNGEPGWLVITRGYLELLTLVRGFQLARGTV